MRPPVRSNSVEESAPPRRPSLLFSGVVHAPILSGKKSVADFFFFEARVSHNPPNEDLDHPVWGAQC